MIFGLSYFRIGAYVVIAIIMGYLVYQYHTGQEAKKQVASLTAERDAEINCLVGSKCANRILHEAQEANEAITKAKSDAQKQNDEDRIKREKAAQESANKQAAEVQQYKTKLAAIEAKHNTPDCESQKRMKLQCVVE